MVGLSIILENSRSSHKPPQIINKTTMRTTKPASPSVCRNSSVNNFTVPAAFLDHCFLCHQKLLPGKDIYMYKGDRAFCSEECRCRQILMDEEESIKKGNCSSAAMKPPASMEVSAPPPPSCTPSSSSSASRHRKTGRN
ncbi:hypothetical protein SLA2020_508600 [Shorea laevis]